MENDTILPTDRGMARLYRAATGYLMPPLRSVVIEDAGSDYCPKHHCIKDYANLCPLCFVDARYNRFVSAREVADIIAGETAIRAAERGVL